MIRRYCCKNEAWQKEWSREEIHNNMMKGTPPWGIHLLILLPAVHVSHSFSWLSWTLGGIPILFCLQVDCHSSWLLAELRLWVGDNGLYYSGQQCCFQHQGFLLLIPWVPVPTRSYKENQVTQAHVVGYLNWRGALTFGNTGCLEWQVTVAAIFSRGMCCYLYCLLTE